MDSRCYLWFFYNINRYNFQNEAASVKETLSTLLITEETMQNPQVIGTLENCYNYFVQNFYNNILGYQNGLANKNITSAELDCYLIQTPDGLVPIGYYKQMRPAESVSLVQNYLEKCTAEISDDKKNKFSGWQEDINFVSQGYAKVNASNKPNKAKILIGAALVALLCVVAAIGAVLVDTDDVAILRYGASSKDNVYICYIIFSFAVAALGGFFAAKGYMLLNSKKITEDVLNNIAGYATNYENGVNATVNQSAAYIYEAARRGENIYVQQNQSTVISADVEKKLATAKSFVSKSDGARDGMPTFMIIILAVFIALTSVGFIPGIGDMFASDDYVIADPVDDDTPDTVDGSTVTPTNPVVPMNDSTVANIIDRHCDYTKFGIYVKNLNNGYEYCYNADETFSASAMCQAVILDALSYAVDDKNIDIDSDGEYFAYISNGKAAPTSESEDGQWLPIKQYIEDVAIYGDNNKSNQLVDYLGSIYGRSNGFDVIDTVLRNNDIYNTRIVRKIYANKPVGKGEAVNETTPRDIGNIFEHLITESNFGSENYMKNIFRSVSPTGEVIGLKKFVPSYYDVCNINALNSSTTNNVAIISHGDTDVLVAVLSNTDLESEKRAIGKNLETDKVRSAALEEIVNHILQTQFSN